MRISKKSQAILNMVEELNNDGWNLIFVPGEHRQIIFHRQSDKIYLETKTKAEMIEKLDWYLHK